MIKAGLDNFVDIAIKFYRTGCMIKHLLIEVGQARGDKIVCARLAQLVRFRTVS